MLVDAAPQVLPPFGAKLGEKAKAELEKLGVEVMLGGMVTEVDERGLEVKFKDGHVERINSVAKIWAAGVQASLAGSFSGLTDAIRAFTAEMRLAMSEREDELRVTLGLDGSHDLVDYVDPGHTGGMDDDIR